MRAGWRVALFLVGCPKSEPPAVPVDLSTAVGVLPRLQFVTTGVGEYDTPQVDVNLEWPGPDGQPLVVVPVAKTVGTCGAHDRTGGAVDEGGCWWAGAGVDYRVRLSDGKLVVEARDLDEGLPEPTPWRALSTITGVTDANDPASP